MQHLQTQVIWSEIAEYLDVTSIAALFCTFDRKLQFLFRQKGTIQQLTFNSNDQSRKNPSYGPTSYLLKSLEHIDEIKLRGIPLTRSQVLELMKKPISSLWVDQSFLLVNESEWNSLDPQTKSDVSTHSEPTTVPLVLGGFPNFNSIFPQLRRLYLNGRDLRSLVSGARTHLEVSPPYLGSLCCCLPSSLETLHIYQEEFLVPSFTDSAQSLPPRLTDLSLSFQRAGDLDATLPTLLRRLPELTSLKLKSELLEIENILTTRERLPWPPHLTYLDVTWNFDVSHSSSLLQLYAEDDTTRFSPLALPRDLKHFNWTVQSNRDLQRHQPLDTSRNIAVPLDLQLMLPNTITSLDMRRFKFLHIATSSHNSHESALQKPIFNVLKMPLELTRLCLEVPEHLDTVVWMLKFLSENCPRLSQLYFTSEYDIASKRVDWSFLPKSITDLEIPWCIDFSDEIPASIRRLRCLVYDASRLRALCSKLPKTLIECINNVHVDLEFIKQVREELKVAEALETISTDSVLCIATKLIGNSCHAELDFNCLSDIIDSTTMTLEVTQVSSTNWLWFDHHKLKLDLHQQDNLTTMNVEFGRMWIAILDFWPNIKFPSRLTRLNTGCALWPDCVSASALPHTLTELRSTYGATRIAKGGTQLPTLNIIDAPSLCISLEILLNICNPSKITTLSCTVDKLTDVEARKFASDFSQLSRLPKLRVLVTGALLLTAPDTLTLELIEKNTLDALKTLGFAQLETVWGQAGKQTLVLPSASTVTSLELLPPRPPIPSSQPTSQFGALLNFSSPPISVFPSSLTALRLANPDLFWLGELHRLAPPTLQLLDITFNPYPKHGFRSIKLPNTLAVLRIDGECGTMSSKPSTNFDLRNLPRSLTTLLLPREMPDVKKIQSINEQEQSAFTWPKLRHIAFNTISDRDFEVLSRATLCPSLTSMGVATYLVTKQYMLPTQLKSEYTLDGLLKDIFKVGPAYFFHLLFSSLQVPSHVESLSLLIRSITSDMNITVRVESPQAWDLSGATSLKVLRLDPFWFLELAQQLSLAPSLETLIVEGKANFNKQVLGPELPRTLTCLEMPEIASSGPILLQNLPPGLIKLSAPLMKIDGRSPPPPLGLVGNITVAEIQQERRRVVRPKRTEATPAVPSRPKASLSAMLANLDLDELHR